MKKLTVFAFPMVLEFYLAARHTHKQLLTLYNPYDFAVNFNVLCTSPHKFTVIDPEGVIAPMSCVDVIVRYSQPALSHCNGADKFRITMQERSSNTLLGKRDILIKYFSGEPENITPEGTTTNENFQPILTKSGTPGKQEQLICNYPSHRDSLNFAAIAIGVGCVIALLLPTQAEPPCESSIPGYLHLSVNLKLVISFVLGLVSMTLIKP